MGRCSCHGLEAGCRLDCIVDRVAPSAKRAAWNRLAAGVAGVAATTVVGGLGVVAVSYPLHHSTLPVQYALVAVMMALESMAVHLPSEVILPLGGWLIVRDHGMGGGGIIALSAVAAAANTAGSLALYAAGRAGGRPLVRRYGRWFLVDEADIDGAERRMAPHRATAVFVSRLLPVVRTYSGFVAGVLRVPVPLFTALTFAGSFIWCAALIALGVALGAGWGAVRLPFEIVGATLLLLLIAALAWVAVRPRASAAGR